ncbi:protein of unknown function [Magnetospira sp. QH-2]|nr:protein of unknown function [Magnetospira sp. QH-2]
MPIHVEQALAKSPPPLQSDPDDSWDRMAPPKPEEIQAIRDKPLAARTHADKRRLHWAEDYGTNEDIQTETTAFYKLNSEVGAPKGHPTSQATLPTGWKKGAWTMSVARCTTLRHKARSSACIRL